MTSHPIDTEALRFTAEATVKEFGPAAWPDIPSSDLVALLDALAAAEHRATRAEAQSAIRGRAVVMYRERAREAEADSEKRGELILRALAASDTWQKLAKSAEARIKAVRVLLDRSRDDTTMHAYPEQLNADIRRALDGSVTPPAA